MAGARRPEVEEARRPLDGHRKVTATRIVYIDIVMVRPRCQGEESFFGRVKLEYSRLKKKHGIHWMDIQRPLLLELCVGYKLTKPCIHVNSVFLGDAST